MPADVSGPPRAFHGAQLARWPDIRFRPIVAADREFLCALYASTRAAELALVPWPDEAKAAFLRQQFDFQDAHYREHFPNADFLLILQDDKAIGRVYVDRDKADIGLIDIALLTECRGRGIGSTLLGELIDEADATQRSISLHVEPNNPAYRLYTRCGFSLVEHHGIYDFLRRTPLPR